MEGGRGAFIGQAVGLAHGGGDDDMDNACVRTICDGVRNWYTTHDLYWLCT